MTNKIQRGEYLLQVRVFNIFDNFEYLFSRMLTFIHFFLFSSSPDECVSASHSTFRWSRLPGQSCKVPNCHLLTLSTSTKGCFTTAFSQNGRQDYLSIIHCIELVFSEFCLVIHQPSMFYSVEWSGIELGYKQLGR